MPSETDKIMKALTFMIEKAVRRVALNVQVNLKESTPKDSGLATANWIPKIGRGSSRLIGSKGAVSYTEQSAAEQKLVGYRLSGGKVQITNATPYVGLLNAGSSPQQPAGFVQRAIEKAVKDIENL